MRPRGSTWHSAKRTRGDDNDSDNEDETEGEANEDDEDGGEDDENEDQPPNVSDDELLSGRRPEQIARAKSEEPEISVQILELHSKNPLISYNGQVYSCTWGRTIGTDLVLARPGTLDETIEPVLRGESFDVISVSRTKLVGKPVVLEPRNRSVAPMDPYSGSFSITSPITNTNSAQLATASNSYAAKHVASDTSANDQPNERERVVQTVRAGQFDPAADERKLERNRWLQRFAEIRIKRGEEGRIPVKSGGKTIDFVPRLPNPDQSTAVATNATGDDHVDDHGIISNRDEGIGGSHNLASTSRPAPSTPTAFGQDHPTPTTEDTFETPWERVKAGRRGDGPAVPRGRGGRPRARATGRGSRRGRGSRSRPAPSLNTIDALIGVREDGTSSSWTGPSPYAPMDRNDGGSGNAN